MKTQEHRDPTWPGLIWVPISFRRELRTAVWWYLAGVIALGLLVGLIGGLSSSPIVATTLPLLFALIAGTSGLYFGNSDLGNLSSLSRLRYLGVVIFSFAVAVGVSGTFGVLLRIGSHDVDPAPLPTLPQNAQSADVELVILNAKLSAVGIDRAGRLQALEAAAADVRRVQSLVPAEELKWYLSQTEETIKTFNARVMATKAAAKTLPDNFDDHLNNLLEFDATLSAWLNDSNLGPITREKFHRKQMMVFYTLTELRSPRSEIGRWYGEAAAKKIVAALFERADAEIALFAKPPWMVGEPLSADLLKMMALIKTPAVVPSDKENLLPSIDMSSP